MAFAPAGGGQAVSGKLCIATGGSGDPLSFRVPPHPLRRLSGELGGRVVDGTGSPLVSSGGDLFVC